MAQLDFLKKLKDSQTHLNAEHKKLERYILLSFIGVMVLCVVSYFFLDQPIAIFMANLKHGPLSLSNFDFTDALTDAAYFFTIFIMVVYVISRFFNIKSRFMEISGVLSIGMMVAFFIKNQAQLLFGRIAPRYGSFEQLNFTRRKTLYGFHFMQAGSFPSGHMVIFTCVFLLLSFYYPRIRWICYLLLTILAMLLIYDNYHFLSDVIAGTYLGVLIAVALKYLLKVKPAKPLPKN
jgi:membrane-associated phospholipid phosphatase